MTLRWKMLVGLGGSLIALGLIGDWPPPTDPSLPDTQVFLWCLGGIVLVAGIVIAMKHEK